MIAALMGKDDIRHSKLMGKKPMWVQATKNLLLGKLNIEELRKAEVIDEQAYQEFITEELPDEMTGEMVAVQNPELAKEVLFDVDWLVNVTLDNQAENDKLEKTQKKQEWFQACIQMGLPMDAKKFMLDMGEETGIEDAEQYVKDEQTVQQEQEMEMQQQQGEQQAQQEAEMQKEQMKHQMGMEAKQAEFAAKQGMTEAQIQAQMQMAQMKQQPMQGGM
jgi:hypothetical protein